MLLAPMGLAAQAPPSASMQPTASSFQGSVAKGEISAQPIDLTLDDADRATIAALPKDQRLVNPPFAPQWD